MEEDDYLEDGASENPFIMSVLLMVVPCVLAIIIIVLSLMFGWV